MMKVQPEIRTAHQRQMELNEPLQEKVRDLIDAFIPQHWHYVGRLKGLESFALKVESGRVNDLGAIDDFFACTIVVRNAAELPMAEEFVRRSFEVIARRPPDPHRTHKFPEAFPFDDIRFYVKLSRNEALPPTDLDDVQFEIQIKTFLQHAWSIATHDLVYKSSDVSWSKARIAYQVKAMLEHAEVAIQEASILSQCRLLDISDGRTAEIVEIIAAIKARWPLERLPVDLKRVAENIRFAFRCFNVGPQRFAEIIDAESAEGRGVNLIDLSPYAATVQALLNSERGGFERFLSKGTRERLFIPRAIEPPQGLDWPPAPSHVTVL